MHRLAKCLVIAIPFVIVVFAPRVVPAATRQGTIRACSLLSKAEVKKIAGSKDRFFDMMEPEEEPLEGGGSACGYSLIYIQIDPFTPARLEELRKQNGAQWSPVAGVGDAAYLFDNKTGGAAEIYARTGQHVVTVQIAVPAPSPGSPSATIKSLHPSGIALAKALVAKLR